MENSPLDLSDSLEQKRNAFRATLRSEFHVTSALLPIKTIAAVIGMCPATLYGYIRSDAFFLPYRRINKTPMVELEDLVEWYCSGEKIEPRTKSKETLSMVNSEEDKRDDLGQGEPSSDTIKGPASTAMDRAVNQALKELGLQNLNRRPRGQRRDH